MHRQFESLFPATEANVQAKKLCEEAFAKLKVDHHFMLMRQKMFNRIVLVTK